MRTSNADLVAIDSDTGRLLSQDEATAAADNPLIYKWVRWVPRIDAPTETPSVATRTDSAAAAI